MAAMAKKKQTFMLVSLNEEKSKELAQVLSNDSCRKILDYLADREHATESNIAKELNLPMSTVHYNLKHLQKGSLVEAEEFHYSEKGKEVNHYKLANKYIIIAPKSTYGIKEKLKSIFPVVVFVGAVSLAFQLLGRAKTFGETVALESAKVASSAPAFDSAEAAVAEEIAVGSAAKATETIVSQPNIALWFFIGAISALIIYLIFDYIREKIKK